MRDLIVSNFLKKYMAVTDPEGDVNSPFYSRLQRILASNVDEYLQESHIANKSVKVLEDYLWDVAKTQSKVLPSIAGAANTFFLHRQR